MRSLDENKNKILNIILALKSLGGKLDTIIEKSKDLNTIIILANITTSKFNECYNCFVFQNVRLIRV